MRNAIIGSDNSLPGGIIGATTLVAVNAALNRWLAFTERAQLKAMQASLELLAASR